MIDVSLEKRICDCCNSNDLEELWHYRKIAKTKHDTYRWNVRNVICRNCGFVFVSPSPSQKFLAGYYMDSYEYFKGQSLDYSVEKRISVIRKYVNRRGRTLYVEIGSNNISPFVNELKKLNCSCTFVELNSSCKKNYSSIDSLRGKKIDIISGYFVLEHIPNPRSYLSSCFSVLKEGGILIIEVPVISLYPQDQAAMLLWEHTNHFSPRSLALLAEKEGFELLKISQSECSRSYGFLSVYRKVRMKKERMIHDPIEYTISKSYFMDGLERINSYREAIGNARKALADSARRKCNSLIWCANAVCIDLLTSFRLPRNVTVVDSNPEKKNYLDLFKTPVFRPDEAVQKIREADLIVINSKLKSDEILKSISARFGKTFKPDEIIVL